MADFNMATSGDYYIMRYTRKEDKPRRVRQRTLDSAVAARDWYNQHERELSTCVCYWATPLTRESMNNRAQMELFLG